MDVAALSQLVGSLGFPIVVAGFLLLRLDRVLQELTKTMSTLGERDREVLDTLRALTQVVQTMAERENRGPR